MEKKEVEAEVRKKMGRDIKTRDMRTEPDRWN